ncbi:MAG: Gfo/Idh/MocA family oxidoreductase [Thermoguttaceae bacterium]
MAAAIGTQVGRAYPAESTKKIRLGVVGGRFGATFWWHEHPKCVVTGVTDLYPDRRAKLRDRFRCNNVYDSLEAMLKEAKDIDAAAIFSGAPDHANHARMCMERGWRSNQPKLRNHPQCPSSSGRGGESRENEKTYERGSLSLGNIMHQLAPSVEK